METRSAVEVARTFLDVVWADPPPGDQRLVVVIDRLLSAAHDVPTVDSVADYTAAPPVDWHNVYRELGKRFPDYGRYAVAETIGAIGGACIAEDAIDDLADLTSDLREVLWRGDVLGPAEADWHFRFSFQTHWGRHARELALYLHTRIGVVE